MTITEIEHVLQSAAATGIRPGLDRITELCRRLGDPQDRIKTIHVAGTNGKGSTSAYMASVLSCAHIRTGWFCSPAVIDKREIIRVFDGDGSDPVTSYVREDVYIRAMTAVIETAEVMVQDGWDQPTVYEMQTACAFLCFVYESVEYAIIEVGMGGKEDATNVIHRHTLAVITPIGLDHMQYLGASISQIAGEKAGIITQNGRVITYQPGITLSPHPDPRAIRRQERNRGMILGRIRSEAEDKKADLSVVEGTDVRILTRSLTGTDFTYREKEYHTGLAGTYQPYNAALAIGAMELLSEEEPLITQDVIYEGIKKATWPARFDIIGHDPLTVYDGAHNPDGAVALAESLRELMPDQKIYALMGVYKDKAVDEILSHVLPQIARIMTVQAPGERGMAAGPLAEHIRYVRPEIPIDIGSIDVAADYKKMADRARRDGAVLLIFGSLSLAEAVYRKEERLSATLQGTGQTLIQALSEQGVQLSAPCGGRGECGRCAVKVIRGDVPETERDCACLSREKREAGFRLSCQDVFHGEVCVELPSCDLAGKEAYVSPKKVQGHSARTPNQFGIAIDLGTTTVATALVRLSNSQVVDVRTTVNPQVSFGADVITRILAASEGKAEKMRIAICETILEHIETILVRNGLGYGQLHHIVIAGNTTMLHLLSGYKTEGLGRAPFSPYTLAKEEKTLGEIVTVVPDWTLEAGLEYVPVTILPGISAFVGADIVSGLFALDICKNDKISVLIDLGTNGEAVIGNKERMMVTSTAAGPALEGGHISCGMAGVSGAIREVVLDQDESGQVTAEYKTVNEKDPMGLCGTGVIDTMAELVRFGIVDENGMLEDPYFDKGFVLTVDRNGDDIAFTQGDVREIQMAKAAVRAGLDTLIRRYGLTPEEVDTVYLAGTFGTNISVKNAVLIGMLPETFEDRTKVVGNTSLSGAIRYLTVPEHPEDEEAFEYLETMIRKAEVLSLADDPDFQKEYIEKMMF